MEPVAVGVQPPAQPVVYTTAWEDNRAKAREKWDQDFTANLPEIAKILAKDIFDKIKNKLATEGSDPFLPRLCERKINSFITFDPSSDYAFFNTFKKYLPKALRGDSSEAPEAPPLPQPLQQWITGLVTVENENGMRYSHVKFYDDKYFKGKMLETAKAVSVELATLFRDMKAADPKFANIGFETEVKDGVVSSFKGSGYVLGINVKVSVLSPKELLLDAAGWKNAPPFPAISKRIPESPFWGIAGLVLMVAPLVFFATHVKQLLNAFKLIAGVKPPV